MGCNRFNGNNILIRIIIIMELNTFNKKVNYGQTFKPFRKPMVFGLPLIKAKKRLQLIKQKQPDSPEKSQLEKNRTIKFEVKCESIELKNRIEPIKMKNKLSMYNFRNQNPFMENIVHTSISLLSHMVLLQHSHHRQTIANPEEHYHYVARPFQNIPSKCIMLNRQQHLKKQGQIVAFYAPVNQYVVLYPALSQISYPQEISNLLPCFGIYQNENTKLKYYIAQMHEEQSLRNIIKQFGSFRESVAQRIVRLIVITLLELHQFGLSHNRINMMAVCMTEESIFLNMFKSSNKPLTEKQKNSFLYYFPPEMLLSRDNYNSKKNDIWAIGCLTLELLSIIPLDRNKYHPYNRVNEGQILTESSLLIEQIQSKYKLEAEGVRQEINLSAKAIDFILKCMRLRLQNRPSAEELLEHPFLKQ